VADILVHEEVCATGRVGEPSRFNNDGVELALAPHQPVDDAHQVAAYGAGTRCHPNTSRQRHDQVVVDADLAKLVDDHGKLLPGGSDGCG
jgi:hypothetical protein